MEEKRNVPKLRFPGFTDNWEQRKYSDVIDLLSGQDFAPSDYNDEGLGMPYMTGASCIQNGQTMEMRWTPIPKCIVEKGDVLLVCKGSGYGTLARLTQEKAHIARQFMALKCKTDLNNTFNYYLAESVANSIKVDARGLIAGIDRSAVLRQDVVLPKIEEQQKIGVFFNNLDNLITLHQRKVDLINEYKKGLLQKMFPKKGETVPEIRFSGFTDPWEQRKLGDMAEIIGGGTPSTTNASYWDGDIDWYAPAEIADQIYVSSSQRKITKEGYENSSAKMLPVGTVLFTSRAGIGKTAILTKESCTNQGFQSIVPNKDLLDSYFIFSRTEELKNYGETVGAGSTFVEVSGKQMAQMTLMMPISLAEQQRIGDFFESIDNLITLHQRKVDLMKEYKKGLLQQMFV